MNRHDIVQVKMTALLVLVLLAGAGPACDAARQEESAGQASARLAEQGDAEEHHDDGLVALTAAEIEEFGVGIAPAGSALIERFIELPGVVRANEDRLAHIVPRFAGIVTDVRKHIGDRVKSGETLAVIESSQSLSPYALETLLSGVIIEKHVTRGEAVTPESQAFVVADLTSV
jgi:cobalt-zinc-cadmium efflux system membrane fusion protein